MNKISSFTVDHNKLKKGLYVSRKDKNAVTYDLRMRAPYIDKLLSNSEIHSFEHLLATFLRNSSISDELIYVGPMGCQTGFYVITSNTVSERIFLDELKKALRQITECGVMYGGTRSECGNADNLDLNAAKQTAIDYYNVIKDLIKAEKYIK